MTMTTTNNGSVLFIEEVTQIHDSVEYPTTMTEAKNISRSYGGGIRYSRIVNLGFRMG